MADGPASLAALLLPVGGLVLLLRDDRFDAAFAQVGAVAAGRVRLVPADRAGPSAGTADGPADPYLLQDGDELRAVGGLARGQDERQWAALPVTGDMDLAGLSTPGASEQGGLQPESASPPDAPSLFPRWVVFGLLSGLFAAAAPFDLAFSASAAAFSKAVRTSSSRCRPAASW